MGADDMGSTEKYDTDVEASGASSPVGVVEISEGESGKLKRSLKGRHMQMIAIGGSIGAGLFVGSGSALNSGGPASLVIDFIIIGIMLLLTVNALGELAGKDSSNPKKARAPLIVCQLSILSPVPSSTTLFASSIQLGASQWDGITR
jgi:hypothetical protein